MTLTTKDKPLRKFNVKLDNYRDKCFHKILTLVKEREKVTLSIFYPKKWHNGTIEHKLRKKKLVVVEKNLFSGKYTNSPWRFIKDVNEVFETIKSSYTKKSMIYIAANEFQEVFSCLMDNLMEEFGYCCGRWYVQQARAILCSGAKNCIIKTETVYYRYEESTFCQKCFDELHKGSSVIVGKVRYAKSLFLQHLFIPSKPEDFVRCNNCYLKMHAVCVLFQRVSGEKFYCKKCRDEQGIETVAVRAKNLPTTECDVFISQFLRDHGINQNETLTIRMLSDMQKLLKEKSIFQAFRYSSSEYTYRNCTLFAFFDTGNDTDICFFSVMFQLYGKNCAEPNQNSAYISYIDSVNLLPSVDRTKIYRLILLGLFAFLKTKGFQKIFLWSCPPKPHQDYTFYMKPPKMRMPSKHRLNNWYTELLMMGVQLKVIESYRGIMQHAEFENWNDINCVPYMEGDLWVVRMEEAIEQVEKEFNKLKYEITNNEKKSKSATVDTKKTLRFAELAALKKKELLEFSKNDRLWQLLTVQLKGFNTEYFVIQLGGTASGANVENDLPVETIKDRIWINNRHLFVDFFWGFMLEFSSERRAQFSTHTMLHRIFMESKICAKCCKVSADGVTGALLCRSCHHGVEHRSKMNVNHPDGSSPKLPSTNWEQTDTFHDDHPYSSCRVSSFQLARIVASKTPESGFASASSPDSQASDDIAPPRRLLTLSDFSGISAPKFQSQIFKVDAECSGKDLTSLGEDKMHKTINYSDTSGCETEDKERIRESSLVKRRENQHFQKQFEAFNSSFYASEDTKPVITKTERLTRNVSFDNGSVEAEAANEMSSNQHEIQRDTIMEPVSELTSKPYYKTEPAEHEPMDDDRNSVFEQDLEAMITSSDDDCIEVEYVPSEPWKHTKLRTPTKKEVTCLDSTDSEDNSDK